MRRTQISDDALLTIFEGKRPKLAFQQSADDCSNAPPQPRFNTVASQCELDAPYMELCDVLIRSQQTGVMTVQHAKERRSVQLWSEKLLLDVRLEERYQRDRIMADRREVMELMRTMLLALAPMQGRGHAGRSNRYRVLSGATQQSSPFEGSMTRGGDTSPSARGSTSLRSFSPNVSVQLQSQPIVITSANGVAFVPDIAVGASTEVERLQERVMELEKQLAQKMRLDWLVHPNATQSTLFGNLPANEAREMANVSQAVQLLEGEEREALAEREGECFANIMTKHLLVCAERQIKEQRRYLIHTPYNAYRPRIPLQHSLQGEEYLRRWLIAETFKHYEDVLGHLQHWENDVRCEIEDEAMSIFPFLRAQVFEPHYKSRCAALEGEMIELRYHKVMHERDASVLASAAKIRLLLDGEERARNQTLYFEKVDRERISEVASSLAVLKDVQSTVVSLRAELSRATERHRQEMIGLHQHMTALNAPLAEERDKFAAARKDAYLQSAFIRGTDSVLPLYETLAAISDQQVAPPMASPQMVPAPPPKAPKTGRRASNTVATTSTPVRQKQEANEVYLRPVHRKTYAGPMPSGQTSAKNSSKSGYWAGF